MKSKAIKAIFSAALVLTVAGTALPTAFSVSDMTVSAVSYTAESRYKVNISLMQFDNDDYSMGNASMKSPATLVID